MDGARLRRLPSVACFFPQPACGHSPASSLLPAPCPCPPAPAENHCFYRIEDWWTYELCFGKQLRQYHKARAAAVPAWLPAIALGRRRGATARSAAGPALASGSPTRRRAALCSHLLLSSAAAAAVQGAGDVIEVQYVLGRYDADQPGADAVQARAPGSKAARAWAAPAPAWLAGRLLRGRCRPPARPPLPAHICSHRSTPLVVRRSTRPT